MIRLLLFFFLQLAWVAQAAVSIEQTETGQFLLSTDSCKSFLEEYRALRTWNQRYLGHAFNDLSTYDCDTYFSKSESKYTINITAFLPTILTHDIYRTNCIEGPNCYGSVAYATGMTRFLGYVGREEFLFFLASPLCSKVDSESDLLPGDIVHYALPKKDKAPVSLHSNIYISKNIFFNKTSPKKDAPYEFLDKTTAESNWDKKLLQTTYHRCGSMEKYASSLLLQKDALSDLVQDILTKLAELEQEQQFILFCDFENKCQSKFQDVFQSNSLSIREDLKQIALPKNAHPNTAVQIQFLRQYVSFRLTSIADMIDMPEIENKIRTKTRMRFED